MTEPLISDEQIQSVFDNPPVHSHLMATVVAKWMRDQYEPELQKLRAQLAKYGELIAAMDRANWFEHIGGGYVVTDKDYDRIFKAFDKIRGEGALSHNCVHGL